MEDNITKVLFIAVSLLATMVTMSLILAYYNTAKELATAAGNRADIAVEFDAIVTDLEREEQYLTGVEVRELIRKYAGDSTVEMNIYSISNREKDAALADAEARKYYVEELLVNGMYDNINNNWLDITTGMIKETYLSIIDPGWESNWVTKEIIDGKIELKLSLDDRSGVHH